MHKYTKINNKYTHISSTQQQQTRQVTFYSLRQSQKLILFSFCLDIFNKVIKIIKNFDLNQRHLRLLSPVSHTFRVKTIYKHNRKSEKIL